MVSHYQAGRGLYIGQVDAYNNQRDQIVQLAAPEELTPNLIYFNGPWYIGAESVHHAEATEGYDDYLALVYTARSVNAVLTAESGEPYKVRVTVNGEYLTEDNRGENIMIGEDGESYLWVTGSQSL